MKVYACEYTDIAEKARELVEINGFSHIVQVYQSSVEELELPEKVDIIISEWQGMILLRESMIDSVIRAREKFLKPDGTLWPSHASIHIAAMNESADRERKKAIDDYTHSMNDWDSLVEDLKGRYGLDYSHLRSAYEKENLDYYINTAIWRIIDPQLLATESTPLFSIELKTVTLEEVMCSKSLEN